MGALGVSLNAFEPATLPVGMNQLHLLYFGLEALKLVGFGLLLKLYFHDLQVSGEA
jgi:hypothetical protein